MKGVFKEQLGLCHLCTAFSPVEVIPLKPRVDEVVFHQATYGQQGGTHHLVGQGQHYSILFCYNINTIINE